MLGKQPPKLKSVKLLWDKQDVAALRPTAGRQGTLAQPKAPATNDCRAAAALPHAGHNLKKVHTNSILMGRNTNGIYKSSTNLFSYTNVWKTYTTFMSLLHFIYPTWGYTSGWAQKSQKRTKKPKQIAKGPQKNQKKIKKMANGPQKIQKKKSMSKSKNKAKFN